VTRQQRQYGTWLSPLSTRMLAARLRFGDVQWDTSGDVLVWSENRGGQTVLVMQDGVDAPRDLTEEDVSVRGRVGYGGGEFVVAQGSVYFVGTGGRLYRRALSSGVARAITPAFGGAAAPEVSADGRWVVYVHTYEGKDCLGLVDTEGKLWPRRLAAGTDFVMQPRWHPDGTRLAYITWDYPLMPWDGAELRMANLAADHAGVPYVNSVNVIAGDKQTAIFQPEFSPDGRYLAYISDQTGYGQLCIYDLIERAHTTLTSAEAEHGQPAWVQGMRVYGWAADGSIYFLRNERGFYSLWHYDLQTVQETRVSALDVYTALAQVAVSTHTGAVAVIASSSQISPRVVSYQPESSSTRVHRRAGMESIPVEQLSQAQPVEWAGHDDDTVYGLYYPPTSTRYEGNGAPPLIVIVHGGPTSQKAADYDIEAQFFATRGYAVFFVNHRGSTGYGRAYMEKLRGNWGVYDVEDAASGARYLASLGLADEKRLAIMGGSAGGFTVLQSLVEKPGFYRAGICRYGVSNQFILAQDTHKFEAHYSEILLGRLPDAAEVYRARSPLFNAGRIVDPVIIFQGGQDTVVPRNQSDRLVESLRARGIPHEYHIYEDEPHAFRKPENIQAYYESIIRFLNQYVIFT
jgi:dipeptidyl aminopeptidase/acylaminoacyl peptidase